MGINHTYRYINTGELFDPNIFGTLLPSITVGSTVTGSISGVYYTLMAPSPYSTSNYPLKVASISGGIVYLLGYYVFDRNQYGYGIPYDELKYVTGTVTIPANVITEKSYVIENCTSPKYSDIMSLSNNNSRILYGYNTQSTYAMPYAIADDDGSFYYRRSINQSGQLTSYSGTQSVSATIAVKIKYKYIYW